MQKQIHIIATSEFMSIDEVVSEKKAEKRLKDIRNIWVNSVRHRQNPNDKLTIKTVVVNPSLSFSTLNSSI